ncbi:hypothetical protein K525DRAFT_288292 [Schizophyllum commune Loenen D]|nr:hypothetical protein K525DRAFT_288292 [Schizophyllum commune Loenen D]
MPRSRHTFSFFFLLSLAGPFGKPKAMCEHEWMGDYYTAQHCHHFHPRHPTGNVTDCGSETCLRSANHKHKNVPDCGCTEAYTVRNRIQNTFRTRCPRCDPQAHPPEL